MLPHMVNVNRHQLPQKDQDELLRRFDNILTSCRKDSTSLFLNELLGREERLTIAKRCMAIVLLHEGYSEYKTAQVLKLSPTTTGSIGAKLRDGAYHKFVPQLTEKKRNYFELLETLDSILHLGGLLPRRIGLDRYRSLSERVKARKDHKL